jgi:multicomponent Na+:H+ antiporter subunit G
MHRFPDFYSRIHAASTSDTLCAVLILLGLGLQTGLSLASFKLFLIFGFLFFTSPTATHALANAALHGGLKPKLDEDHSGERQ